MRTIDRSTPRARRVLAVLLVGGLPLAGQAGAPARAEAMTKLEHWVGEWEGTGWTSASDGPAVRFDVVESVQRKAGGTVLLVEGLSTAKVAAGADRIVHDGLALISFDEKTGRYHWQGHDAPWGAIDAEATCVDGGLQWSFAADERGTVVRFTLRVDEHRWHEVGDVSVDRKSWTTFMETNLSRKTESTRTR